MAWGAQTSDISAMPSLRKSRVGIGVDLGTTYSGVAIAFVDQRGQHQRITVRNAMNEVKFPSVVYFALDGKTLVGKEAINRAVAEKRESDVLRHFKLKMGTDEKITYNMNGQEVAITPIELSAILLRAIKQMVEGKLHELNLQHAEQSWVISVPGRWELPGKFATRDAAIAAGLDPNRLDLIEEPTAAAIATRAAMPNEFLFLHDEAMMIIDFGGGTLDLSIVRPHQNDGRLDVVLAPGGNDRLGGTNIDSAVALLLISSALNTEAYKPHTVNRDTLNQSLARITALREDRRARIVIRAERLKEHISDEIASGTPDEEYTTSVQGGPDEKLTPTIRRKDFEDILRLANGEIERSVKAYLQEAEKHNLPVRAISRVVLVGGASMLPGIEEAISKVFDRRDVRQSKMPVGVRLSRNQRQEMIQLGAAMFAYDPTLIDARVCGFTCGVESSRDWRMGDQEHLLYTTQEGRKKTKQYSRFFKRNEQVALEGVTQSFSPVEDGQTSITFRVLEGEKDDPTKNKEIGRSTVPVDGNLTRDQVSVMCKFVLERDNLLHVYTWNPKTNERGEEVKFEWKSGSAIEWLDG